MLMMDSREIAKESGGPGQHLRRSGQGLQVAGLREDSGVGPSRPTREPRRFRGLFSFPVADLTLTAYAPTRVRIGEPIRHGGPIRVIAL